MAGRGSWRSCWMDCLWMLWSGAVCGDVGGSCAGRCEGTAEPRRRERADAEEGWEGLV